jgi:two-component system heavy metal sensor histidine kinase CusS
LRVIGAAALAVLLTTVLGFVILKHGLRPLTAMSRRVAEITPTNLTARLREDGIPTELQQLSSAFNAMLDRLDMGFLRLSQFSSDLAHEIRTPINILMGQTQVTLGQTRNQDEYIQVLESNQEELTRLSHIIENILFLAHVDHAALSVERQSIDHAGELQKISDYFEGMGDERNMRFEVNASGTSNANLDMWRRAVSNLVINAIRYGQSSTPIYLCAHADQHGATIIVENHGVSMPPEQMERVFDRFYRGDKSRSEYTESNGLGLAIVKAIMLLHGGSVSVTGTPDGLIRFSLYFPLTNTLHRAD